MRRRDLAGWAAWAPVAAWAVLWPAAARADAAQALRDFVRDARSGRGRFTQTVISPDGSKRRTSSGELEFLRPDRFRFAYAKPQEQLIIGDGQKVWIHDPDLNQATSRPQKAAVGGTPAALLAGGNVERDFELAAQPDQGGLQWVTATPRQKDTTIQRLRAGFRGRELMVLEIVDSFGQRSVMEFTELRLNLPIGPERFRYTPPPGTEVVEQ